MTYDISQIASFPREPGVYIMKDCRGKVLYVGKAKNLRNRVKQYFGSSGDGRAMIPHLVAKVAEVETIVVDSEKEALLLENNLIKKYTPPYNAVLKDDKTFICLKISTSHDWPMVQVVRFRGKPKGDGQYFGPYTGAFSARQTLELINRLFPLRQCSDQELARRDRPCILYQMGRCIAPCVGLCTQEEYSALVAKVSRFLSGRDDEILQELYSRMEVASEALQFEKAQELLSTIRHIEATTEEQRVEKVGGGDFDVWNIYREGAQAAVAVLLFRHGKLVGSQSYDVTNSAEESSDLLVSLTLQHYERQPNKPKEVFFPEVSADHEAFAELTHLKVLCPQRGDKRRLILMAGKNAEAAFRRNKDDSALNERALLELQSRLRLTRFPRRIECVDTAHLAGGEPVAALVVFTEGEKDPKFYRRYKIKEAQPGDDYGAIREVLTRRYKRAKEENNIPDLIIVDGGKGQLNAASKVLEELDIASVDLIALTKEEGRHDKGLTNERVFVREIKDPISLQRHSQVLFLLQKIRDEAHRFAITFHRHRRSKGQVKTALAEVPGIGPVKQKRLLKAFGSVKKIKEATDQQLLEVSGISQKDVENLRKGL